jgi:hypothetical protein
MLPTRQTNLLLSDLMFAFSASAWMPMLVEFGMWRMQLVSGMLWFIGNFITHLLNFGQGDHESKCNYNSAPLYILTLKSCSSWLIAHTMPESSIWNSLGFRTQGS